MTKEWRRIKVLVELPVRGNLSERDVRWEIERALQASDFEAKLHHFKGREIQTGRLLVKSFSRYIVKVQP